MFPSAVLLGAPAGPTRVISIAAYEAAFEQYDYSLASAIAMIMALVQLVIVLAVLSLRTLFYRGPAWRQRLTHESKSPAQRTRLDHRRMGGTGFFIVNLFAMIAAVLTSSFATRWLGTWLPAGWTTHWYFSAWDEFQLDDVLIVTFEVVFAVVVLSGLLGVPAAYALARREFPGKKLVMLLFLLPLLVPPITYGIPLATVLYKSGLGGTMSV